MPGFVPVFWHWLILGSVLVALEALVPGTFLLWPGLAAFVTGIVAYMAPGLGWETHALIFGILTVLAAVAGRSLYARLRHPPSQAPLLNQRQAQLVGTVHVLDSAIADGRGRLHVGDSSWSVTGPDLPAGTKVRVVAVDGNILTVEEAPR
jgi:membrane protein implicated in regulation of membrane protease activity